MFTDQQKTDIRRHCGYPVYGAAPEGNMGWRFFIAYGQLWCENVREESARNSALVDPHSPGRWRVNGAVQNFDEFGKAFSCKKGAPMYPENSCRVW